MYDHPVLQRGPYVLLGSAAALLYALTQCGLAEQGTGVALGDAAADASGGGQMTSDAAGAEPSPEASSGDDDGDAVSPAGPAGADSRVVADTSMPLGDAGAGDAAIMTCGTSPCDLTANVCCTCANCALPFPTGCFPAFPGCVPSATYMVLTCGGPENCPANETCCASFSGSTFTAASCRPTCATTDVRLCQVDADCPAQMKCKALASIPGFTGCQ